MSRLALASLRVQLARRPRIPDTAEEPSAAVATVLREGAEGAEVLFIERAERTGDPWSGHVAFPGGKRDARDASLLETAIRETEEEVGLHLSVDTLLARLEDVRARSNGYRVAQFVFALDDGTAELLANAEVASTQWVPLAYIERSGGKDTMPFRIGESVIELPCVRLGTRTLWGMTYRMVSQVIDAAE